MAELELYGEWTQSEIAIAEWKRKKQRDLWTIWKALLRLGNINVQWHQCVCVCVFPVAFSRTPVYLNNVGYR